MSSSNSDPRVSRSASFGWQALLAAGLGCLALLGLWSLFADGFVDGIRLLYVATHEAAHAVAALLSGGHVHNIQIEANGSGRIAYQGDEPALVAAAGPVGPAWISALLLWMAAARRLCAPTLVLIAIDLVLAGLFATTDPRAAWVLYVAASFGFLGALGLPKLIHAAVLFAYVLALAVGVQGAMDYLHILAAPGDPDRLSDVAVIAKAFGDVDPAHVRRVLLLAMGLGYAIAALAIANALAPQDPTNSTRYRNVKGTY